MLIAGVDYSLTTPSICVTKYTDSFTFGECQFYFLTSKQKLACKHLHGKIIGKLHYPYLTAEQRYDNISQWAIDVLNTVQFLVLEDYAFAAKGRVFHIGENTGLLKHQLWRFKKHFEVAAPTTIKKFATGKGNAKKEQMYEAFLAETECDLMKLFDMHNVDSPINDIVDSFYMTKYAHRLYGEAKSKRR
jgi:Holliday junction resolvasome RuvABC endonuclease subunit